MRIGSVNERCSGTAKPGTSLGPGKASGGEFARKYGGFV
jgi:hypothetical protein